MKNIFIAIAVILMFIAFSCKNGAQVEQASTADETEVITPVTISYGKNQTLQDSITLSAVSTYLLSTDIKANINGYINSVKLHLGDPVDRGQILFVLQTKESRSLGSTINNLDSSFKFSGINSVKSTASGYITELNHQAGDYVLDGDILARITDKNSFGFILNLPFEYRSLIHINKAITVELPDGTKASGMINRIMPQMDSASQTQQVFIKSPTRNIPSGLIAKVVLTRDATAGFTLPKGCIYADESQNHFWVMRLLNDSTAVKIPVIKSLENSNFVSITAPNFSPKDRFILQGGYGLTDTAKISIQP